VGSSALPLEPSCQDAPAGPGRPRPAPRRHRRRTPAPAHRQKPQPSGTRSNSLSRTVLPTPRSPVSSWPRPPRRLGMLVAGVALVAALSGCGGAGNTTVFTGSFGTPFSVAQAGSYAIHTVLRNHPEFCRGSTSPSGADLTLVQDGLSGGQSNAIAMYLCDVSARLTAGKWRFDVCRGSACEGEPASSDVQFTVTGPQ
jgi:hypothetical protein